jgi:UDP-N-acetylmuramoyl-tripeptide--D-alanyl-D-alanine ligase
VRVIDDTYNANPDSVLAAIKVVSGLTAKPIMVLGELAELGGNPLEIYTDLGIKARQMGIARLFVLGNENAAVAHAFGANGFAFTDFDSLMQALILQLEDDDVVLVKGSRIARMERIVEALISPREVTAC